MNILILHGIEGKAGIHWQQWLHDELIKIGHNVIMPTLTNAVRPDRQTWLNEVIKLMSNIKTEDTIIVGHSLGVVTALDYIEQSEYPIKSLISVSGFSHPMGTELNEYFMIERSIDFNKVKLNIGQPYVLFGDNDPYVNQTELLSVAKDLEVEPIIFHNGGHLNTDAGFTEFPKILEIINNLK